MEAYPVKIIATHQHPHADEIVALWLAYDFGGEKVFPGITTASIKYWCDNSTPDKRPVEEWEAEGYLVLGTAGSRFDEHGTETRKRKEQDCCATLMAKFLDVEEDPALGQILFYTLQGDKTAKDGPFGFGALIKMKHGLYLDDPQRVITWAMDVLRDKYKENEYINTRTRADYVANAHDLIVEGPAGQQVKLVYAETNNLYFAKFARWRKGGCAEVVVQQQHDGHVQIHTAFPAKLRLNAVTREIRLAEQRAKGQVVNSDRVALATREKVLGVEEWYFPPNGGQLFNGTYTHGGVPATRLSLDEIVSIITEFLFKQ